MLTTKKLHTIYILSTLYIIYRYMLGDTSIYIIVLLPTSKQYFSHLRRKPNTNLTAGISLVYVYIIIIICTPCETITNVYWIRTSPPSSIVCSSINIFQIADGGRVCEIFFLHRYTHKYRQCRFVQTGKLNIKTLWRCTPPGSCGREKRKRIEFPRS